MLERGEQGEWSSSQLSFDARWSCLGLIRWAWQHGSIHQLCLKETQKEEMRQRNGAEQRFVLSPSVWGLLTLASGQPLTFLLCTWLAKQAQVGPRPYSPPCDQGHCSRYTSHPFLASQMPLPSLLPEVWNQVNQIMLAYTRTLQQNGYKIYKSFHIYVFYIKSDKVMFLGRIQVADK